MNLIPIPHNSRWYCQVLVLVLLWGFIAPNSANAQTKLESLIFESNRIQLWESLPEPSQQSLQRELQQIKQDVSLRDIQLRLQSGVTTGYMPSWYRALIDTSQSKMFKTSYRYTDINADGRTDLVYTGYPISFNQPSTVIWLLNENHYELIGQRSGLLYALQPGKSPSLIMQQGQCCGNYILRYDVVSMNMRLGDNATPSFSVDKSYVAFKNTYIPRGTVPSRTRAAITVTTDRAELRFSPVQRDNLDAQFSRREQTKAFGNIVAIFHKGDRGILLGTHSEAMERGEWWLVAFKPKILGSYNRFYNDRNAHRIGWIRSQSATTGETTSNL
jgi:hypothetical protein